jgi:hypothetical protein
VFLPISFGYLFAVIGILLSFDALPQILEIDINFYKEMPIFY